MTTSSLQQPRFIGEAEIAACAAALSRQAALCCENFTPPYPLVSIIWNHLYEVDELALDEETPLGIDDNSGEPIWGKTLADERLIMIDPSVVGKPYYRFTLAHEIGHWMLHCRPQLKTRERLAKRLGGETAERLTAFATTEGSITGKALDRLEIQANMFAAHLLMPSKLVKEEYRKRFGSEVHPADYAATAPLKMASSPLLPLTELFGVSKATMSIRLRALGLAT